MILLPSAERVHVATEPMNLRKSFERGVFTFDFSVATQGCLATVRA